MPNVLLWLYTFELLLFYMLFVSATQVICTSILQLYFNQKLHLFPPSHFMYKSIVLFSCMVWFGKKLFNFQKYANSSMCYLSITACTPSQYVWYIIGHDRQQENTDFWLCRWCLTGRKVGKWLHWTLSPLDILSLCRPTT